MLQIDFDVGPGDVQELKNSDSITGFFAKLGYDTNKRVVQNPQHLGISNQTLRDQIKRVERIAENGSLKVYFLELSSVTVANTLLLSRSFKEMSGLFILVLTSDYERIDFILLERVVPLGKKFTVTTKPRFTLRPRSLTVNRSNLDNISRRVLRRLTFTEGDEFAQYDKIRSAYTMADWAEEHFNNRALFSDYFLIHRLKDDPVWKEKAEPSFLFFKNTLKPFSYQWHNIKEKEFLSKFIEQVLTELGFDHEKTSRTSDDLVRPHYNLFTRRDKKKVGAVLSYVWGRNLDAKDYTRDSTNPEENPSQAVVTVLEEEKVPWVIVTNGKVWRLYSAKAHSRATNYYEIDLEETIALNDPGEAFRYYWLLFREAAFIPRSIEGEERKMSFLDKLFYDSQDYSLELEKRLKAKVFEEVFPFFAEGFLKNIGGKEKLLALSEDKRNESCKEVFSVTLTILYRLLFLLYAESRDLLPVKEVRGYFEKSLTKLKKAIAGKAGNIADDVESKLKSSYTKSNTELYDRFMELAEIIDKGKSTLNVPTYNGGLFLTEPTEEDDTREAEIARFLTEYKIPDYYLAMGLDKLARDDDPKRFELVPIDYKSLGVRQLGSIYEGLLEFNVRIAPEKMAVVKGKKTEQIVPYSDTVEKKLKILTIGRGSEKREYTLPRGTVYIENDKKERKATGSYYTPDYIVKYIVENTVGPVLEEKFKEVRSKLRRLRSDQLETEAAKKIIDELFDIHVLDPAMGSGHFLVETVDYITDKMLDFLNGFHNNPVQLELQKTRDAIMDEMNNQSVSIDQNKLIDVSLMKRTVLKRCVYGVDINPMAVELAKVSLWLDCFTLGAPLSFLDHHLKCGNSLIGANLKEAEKEIETGQMTIWATSKFGGVKRASEHMIHVGELSDITTNMIKESKKEYCEATREIAPYKRLLDIYVSRWFSNSPIVTGKGKKKKEFDYTLDFLRSDEISEWLKDTSETKHLENDQQQIIKNALTDAEKKRFFHWELEFPEIFCGKREEERGFDAAVGNPPYVRQEGLGDLKTHYLLPNYKVYHGSADLYSYFFERGINLLQKNGIFSMITSNKFMRSNYGEPLRKYLINNAKLIEIVDFGELPVFEDAATFPAISIIRKSGEFKPVRFAQIPKIDFDSLDKAVSSSQRLLESEAFEGKNWMLESGGVLTIFRKMENLGVPLGEYCQGKIKRGVLTGFNKAFIIDKEKKESLIAEDQKSSEIIKPIITGDDVRKYQTQFMNRYLIWTYIGIDIENYPAIRKHLEQFKEKLEKRWDKGNYWYELRACNYYEYFEKPKIFIPAFALEPRFSIDDGEYFVNAPAYLIPKKDDYLLALLNSHLCFKYLLTVCSVLGDTEKRGRAVLRMAYYERLPIRRISFTTAALERARLVEGAKKMYAVSEFADLLKLVDECLPKDERGNFIAKKEKSDVVHDILAFLAKQMIKMNDKKQIEARKFLDWVESRFHVDLEELSSRTVLIGYYKHDFEKFYSVLTKNKNHFYNIRDVNVKRELITEFKKSMETIEPLLDRIETTDDLIDQIVYKLYGLTDEEIEIVEKRVGGH